MNRPSRSDFPVIAIPAVLLILLGLGGLGGGIPMLLDPSGAPWDCLQACWMVFPSTVLCSPDCS